MLFARLAEAGAGMVGGEKKKFPVWAIVLIVLGVLLVCVLPICVILILALLGPAIGEVFSNVIEEI
nr:hypothetical protein [Anaerolineae bacterium]